MAVQARLSFCLCVGLVASTLSFKNLSGQQLAAHFRSGPQLGVGWVANVPTSYVGFSVMALTPAVLGGGGFYADIKVTSSSPESQAGFLPDVTPQGAELTFGDLLFTDESEWLTIDLAAVYAVTAEFALYAGAGYSDQKHYRQYYDESETRGEFGFYWVSDPEETGTRVNLLGGAIMRVNRLAAFQAGGQTQPAGVNVGVVLTLVR
jgi:hypothetical protein